MKKKGYVVLGFLSVAICFFALMPGSLGILSFTHNIAAHPVGAWFIYKLSAVLFVLSLIILTYTLFKLKGFYKWAILLGFLGICTYGFFMHTSFMFKPIKAPKYISLEKAYQLFGEEEGVTGVLDREGTPYAYITKLQRRPHIIYQTVGGAPFISTHCILANSSMAYELNKEFAEPQICISSVTANNLVFFDKSNNRSYQQIFNESSDGRHRLKLLPTIMTTLGVWKKYYPESKVWVRDKDWRDSFYLKFLARKSVIDQSSPDLIIG